MIRSLASRPSRDQLIDIAAFAVCVAAMLFELGRSPKSDPTALAPVAIVLIALPALFRRRFPVTAFWTSLALIFALVTAACVANTVGLAAALCGYTLAERRGRVAGLVGGAVAIPVVISILQFFSPHGLFTMDTLRNMALVVVPLTVGVAAHERRTAAEALLARAEAAEHYREEETRRRLGEERLRIARDVHDVVAHAMVAINIQAGVGAHLLDRDPEQARRTLREIKQVSGEALGDLRAMLGLLRREDDGAPVVPTLGLAEIEDLHGSLGAVGVELTVEVDPATADLPATVGVAGYRIVQEALTNVIRHAGRTRARVAVSVHGADDARVVTIAVEDEGGEGSAHLGDTGSGHGLRGMRERAIALGGTLEAGPRPGGGWRVTATLPVLLRAPSPDPVDLSPTTAPATAAAATATGPTDRGPA